MLVSNPSTDYFNVSDYSLINAALQQTIITSCTTVMPTSRTAPTQTTTTRTPTPPTTRATVATQSTGSTEASEFAIGVKFELFRGNFIANCQHQNHLALGCY